MPSFRVNEKCVGCLACVDNCPGAALAWRDEGARRVLLHNLARCARCATCWRVCPHGAVEFGELLAGDFAEVVSLELLRCSEGGKPLGTTKLTEWMDRHRDTLGRRYTSEMARRVDRASGYRSN